MFLKKNFSLKMETLPERKKKRTHPKIFFKNILACKVNPQKLLGLHLDSKLSFDFHIKTNFIKVNKTIAFL